MRIERLPALGYITDGPAAQGLWPECCKLRWRPGGGGRAPLWRQCASCSERVSSCAPVAQSSESTMDHQLAASAAAINELCSSLEDESLSSVTVSGSAASFNVRGDDGMAYTFVATFAGASLPCPASLACTSGSVRGLAKANGKLGAKSSLAKAVAAAGRCVAVDLDWVAEAEEAGACCCAPPPARCSLRPPRACPGATT